MQQRTAEQIENEPQFAEGIVEVMRFAPREQVQQRTIEQIEDLPHFADRRGGDVGLA